MQYELFRQPEHVRPSFTLRPYQSKAVSSIFEQWINNQSTLLVLPTGTGKTICFAKVIDRAPEGRVMVLAHREELITQARDKIRLVTGEPVDIEMASRYASDHNKTRIVVSSIQTQIAGENGNGRMTRFRPNEFTLLIVDEARRHQTDTTKKL
jgi:superfamily II DNA or RNA helicase